MSSFFLLIFLFMAVVLKNVYSKYIFVVFLANLSRGVKRTNMAHLRAVPYGDEFLVPTVLHCCGACMCVCRPGKFTGRHFKKHSLRAYE